jgi:hypothetical protein
LVKDIKDEDGFVDINGIANLETEQGSEFLEGTIVINVTLGTKGERTRLQLCE